MKGGEGGHERTGWPPVCLSGSSLALPPPHPAQRTLDTLTHPSPEGRGYRDIIPFPKAEGNLPPRPRRHTGPTLWWGRAFLTYGADRGGVDRSVNLFPTRLSGALVLQGHTGYEQGILRLGGGRAGDGGGGRRRGRGSERPYTNTRSTKACARSHAIIVLVLNRTHTPTHTTPPPRHTARIPPPLPFSPCRPPCFPRTVTSWLAWFLFFFVNHFGSPPTVYNPPSPSGSTPPLPSFVPPTWLPSVSGWYAFRGVGWVGRA